MDLVEYFNSKIHSSPDRDTKWVFFLLKKMSNQVATVSQKDESPLPFLDIEENEITLSFEDDVGIYNITSDPYLILSTIQIFFERNEKIYIHAKEDILSYSFDDLIEKIDKASIEGNRELFEKYTSALNKKSN